MPGISDLLDSDMEENNFIDENSLLSSASDVSDVAPPKVPNSATTKKTKKRTRVTMPKPKSRVTKSSPAATTKKTAKQTVASKRKAIENAIEADTIPESQQDTISEPEDILEVEDKPKTKRKPAAKRTTKNTKIVVDQAEDEGVEVEQTPAIVRSSHAQTTTKAAPKIVKTNKTMAIKKIPQETIIEPEIQTIDQTMEVDEVDEIATQQPPFKRARTESRTRQEPTFRKRAGSASDTERGDPNLRRKLGDITRKFENIDMKYRNLKEVGVTEANANVEKLRKQCEATTEASNTLISSLKKELAQHGPLLQDARKLKKDLQLREDEVTKLRASQAEITASLVTAQNEIKTLQAKLAAARTVSVEPQPTKTPGSAIKVARTTAMVNGETMQALQTAQMKLDLYGDLTGLIVRSVKRAEDGDTFDCIQTGRNGTLHFKLFIDQEDARSSTFEETEFLYTPLLDANRDRDMMELMPPYLTEDITFARQNAAKFYQRVVDTLTRRTNEV